MKDLPVKEKMNGYKARMIHSEKMTTVYYTVEAGAAFSEHSHMYEQISNVIEGKFQLNWMEKLSYRSLAKL